MAMRSRRRLQSDSLLTWCCCCCCLTSLLLVALLRCLLGCVSGLARCFLRCVGCRCAAAGRLILDALLGCSFCFVGVLFYEEVLNRLTADDVAREARKARCRLLAHLCTSECEGVAVDDIHLVL